MNDRAFFRFQTFVVIRIVLVLWAVAVPVMGEQTMTRLYKPVPANTDGCAHEYARWCPGSDGLPIEWVAGCGKIKFTDPVPRGSIVTRIDVRVGIDRRWSESTEPPVALVWAMNHSHTQPERIMGYALQPVSDARHCEPGQFQLLPIDGAAFAGGIPFYNYGGTNYAQVRNADFEGHSPYIDLMELTFHYEPAAVVKFELSPGAPETERRVLIHKFRSNDSYFAAAQETLRSTPEGAPRRIEVRGTVTDADGATLAGKKIYLRVADPADTAPYVPAAQRVTGDNADASGGRLEEVDAQGQIVPVRRTTVTSDSSGRFKVVLRVTNSAAGDNYQVEASSLQDFGATNNCGTANNCYASGTFVAWKRVYIEVGRMFRRGSYIAANANVGDKKVRVMERSPFAPGNTIVLIHAPASPGHTGAPGDFWSATRTIAPGGVESDSSGPGGTLTFADPLPNSFLGVSGTTVSALYPSVSVDFVGVLSGDPAKDYYEPNLAYIKSLFNDAFVDYVLLDPVPLPHVEKLVEDLQVSTSEETHRYVQRWFRHKRHSNHQFVFGSEDSDLSESPTRARAVTRAIEGLSYSHIMVPKILGLLATTNSRRLLGEVTAHEISHQWHTNRWSSHTVKGEHCNFDFRAYDDSSKACLMRSTYEGPNGITLPEFMDDKVRFHYLVTPLGVDSEYRWIRERCDPIPAQPFMSSVDWWTMPPSPCR